VSESDHPSSGDEIRVDHGVIKVYVREIDQFFDSMDPSPFHEKGLNRDAHEYIVSLAKELPGGRPTALVVYLAQPVGLPDEARILGDAIRVYFARRAEQTQRKLQQMLRREWVNLVVGLSLLVASVIVGHEVARRMGQGALATVLRESLLIGGWVAMWHPLEFFLYDLWQGRAERRIYQRLSRAAIRVVYTGPRSTRDGDDGQSLTSKGFETSWPTPN
jgi:hypothetical protein